MATIQKEFWFLRKSALPFHSKGDILVYTERRRNNPVHERSIQPVYLSPHLDDAVLSCGGLIHQQKQQGFQPLVITCFAGVPDYQALSPFAIMQHQRWGETAHPIEHRRQEDVLAMACLGAAYEHWDYLDCIYRRHPESGEFLYTTEEALFSAVASVEHYLVDELAARLKRAFLAQNVLIYAPLAVGQHVDHQLVSQAALRLRDDGFLVWLYEDYPYAEDAQKIAKALQCWASPPKPTVHILREEDMAAKIAAVRCYASQLATLFGDEASVPVRMKAYALAVGGGQGYGERYWKEGVR
jgi:LmbE family N-acetylglucosaminyl deacetylase